MSHRIAIDMDEVLADTLAKELSVYNLEHHANVTKDDLAGQKLYQKVRLEHRERVRDYPRAKDFFRDIPVMEGSQEVLRELVKHYEVFITTAAMEYPTSFTAKYEWIKEHFPLFPDSHIVFCGDKSIIAADFLIDDSFDPTDWVRGNLDLLQQDISWTVTYTVPEPSYLILITGTLSCFFLRRKSYAEQRD